MFKAHSDVLQKKSRNVMRKSRNSRDLYPVMKKSNTLDRPTTSKFRRTRHTVQDFAAGVTVVDVAAGVLNT